MKTVVSADLRTLASKARRLAAGITDTQTITDLTRYAEECDIEAERLDQEHLQSSHGCEPQ